MLISLRRSGFKEETKEPVIAKDETIIYNVDPVVPTAYINKPPFLLG